MKKTSQKDTQTTEVLILPSSEALSKAQAQELAQELARLQDDLLQLSTPLPDTVRIFREFQFTRKKNYVNFFMHTPLFYQEDITVSLTHNNNGVSLYGEGTIVQGGWDLKLHMFSDKQMRVAFIRFAKRHPYEAGFADVFYSFDTHGNYAKTLQVHSSFGIERQVIRDLNVAKVYHSEMTAEDFRYAERALTIMKDRVEDYIKFGLHPQNTATKENPSP